MKATNLTVKAKLIILASTLIISLFIVGLFSINVQSTVSYNENAKISEPGIGKAGTHTGNANDIRFDTYDFRLNYHMNKNIRVTAYYDHVINEKTLVTAYTNDIKDNVLTLRMEYKF